MFNSRLAIAPNNQTGDGEQPKTVAPTKRVKKQRSKRPEVGNPGLSLSKNHPAYIYENRRKDAARKYIRKANDTGLTPSSLAISSLGLAQSKDGTWTSNGTPDPRLFGENLTKYNDTKLVPKNTEGGSSVTRSKKRMKRLLNKGYANRDYVTFGTLVRNPYFKIDISDKIDGSNRVPIGRDSYSGKVLDPLSELTAHHFNSQKEFLDTIDGIDRDVTPQTENSKPKFQDISRVISKRLRNYTDNFGKSLKNTSFNRGLTTLANNIQSMTTPYDRTELQPPTPDQMSKAKDLVRSQRPDLFDAQGGYANSDVASQVNSVITRHIVDRNRQNQLQQHRDEYSGLIRAAKNAVPCPCPHCQISNYENPLATTLDGSLLREIRESDDEILKSVYKSHFGLYHPHQIMIRDPKSIFTGEDGKRGGGYPHPLSTNIVRQILYKRSKMKD